MLSGIRWLLAEPHVPLVVAVPPQSSRGPSVSLHWSLCISPLVPLYLSTGLLVCTSVSVCKFPLLRKGTSHIRFKLIPMTSF